ncbi:dihydroorotase [Deltaproteobacteria bacterium]|nr:dihydroorotase [Deltaproteobacteria bacterium]
MYDLIIEDGTILSGAGRTVADIAVEGGEIVYVGTRPAGGARRRVSAIGRFVAPGLIDTHVHFRDPGHPQKEDWASGSRAAASGGVTTVCDMPNTSPPTITTQAWLDKAALAADRSRVNFGIWFGAAAGNVDEARRITDEGPACGIKVFMGASTGPLLVNDATLVEFFEKTRGLMGVHAEDEGVLQAFRERWAGRTPPTHHDSRPAEAAVVAVQRLIELVRAHPRPVHVCHVSTAAELAVLEAVRGSVPITTEVAPHHLWLNNEEPLGNLGKVNPPLRPESDRRALWTAVRRGLIDTVGSDHAPHTLEEKGLSYDQAPSGIPGVELTFSLLMSAVKRSRLPLELLVQMTSEAPAARFGFARKGQIRAGFDADLVVFREVDLVSVATMQLYTRVGWSPYAAQKAAPKPELVFVAGRLVAENGVIVDDEGRGCLVSPSRGEA